MKYEEKNIRVTDHMSFFFNSLQNACNYCIYCVYRKYNYYEIGIHCITKYTAEGQVIKTLSIQVILFEEAAINM